MGYVYIILAAVTFSTMEIAGKVVSDVINPFQLNFLRFLIGGLILLPPTIKALKDKGIKLDRKDLCYFIINGLLCVVISMSFFQLAIVYTKASTVAIIFSTNPIFTIPFAYLILKEDLNKATIASLILSLIGIVCILNPFAAGHSGSVKGIILCIVAALTFSIYSVIGKMKSSRYGSIAMNCLTFLAGDIIMFVLICISKLSILKGAVSNSSFAILSDIPMFQGINAHNVFTIIYLGVVVTGLGYLFYFLAMDKTSATTASVVFFIKPALAPILALIILKESIPFNTIMGILFILFGSLVTFTQKKNKPSMQLEDEVKVDH
ncbi:DMT family transporter [Clostridium sp. WILCCON 0269]|uniref:DMT family transporter n=1 Tax=Candidatus Clostridium eludens TaxID=3381663 RepID=A0ABW8SGT1_9CLOT